MKKLFNNPYNKKCVINTFKFISESTNLQEDLKNVKTFHLWVFIEQFINAAKYWDNSFTNRHEVMKLLKKICDEKAYPWIINYQDGFLLYFSKKDDTLNVIELTENANTSIRFRNIFEQLSIEEKTRIAQNIGKSLIDWETELTYSQRDELRSLL